ncbi:hypothetical protein V6N12_014147 [Hibiscus sabdariffa]|uniref:Uncharacterized protein n=1 Tax=Hibiscus sabdariffa TaxID=183260 RepID=A0ABR2DJ99_9ROSI
MDTVSRITQNANYDYETLLSRSLLKPLIAALSKVILTENLKVTASEPPIIVASLEGLELDRATEAERNKNGFWSRRKTKIICTIRPRTCRFEEIEALAVV